MITLNQNGKRHVLTIERTDGMGVITIPPADVIIDAHAAGIRPAVACRAYWKSQPESARAEARTLGLNYVD